MDDWPVPMTKINNHVYVRMPALWNVLFTKAELASISSNFNYPLLTNVSALFAAQGPTK